MGPPLALPPSVVFKKPLPVMKMRLRITDTSADIISGAKTSDVDKARNDENREEGNLVVYLIDYYFLSAADNSAWCSDLLMVSQKMYHQIQSPSSFTYKVPTMTQPS